MATAPRSTGAAVCIGAPLPDWSPPEAAEPAASLPEDAAGEAMLADCQGWKM